VDTEITGDLGDRLSRLDHHHRFSLELLAEPSALSCPTPSPFDDSTAFTSMNKSREASA
jgi:hypothetical protein